MATEDRLERIAGLMGQPGARTWFVLIVASAYFGLWLFGFNNVMDRVGLTRPPVEGSEPLVYSERDLEHIVSIIIAGQEE